MSHELDPALIPGLNLEQWRFDKAPLIRKESPLFAGRPGDIVMNNIHITTACVEFKVSAKDYSLAARIGVFHIPRLYGESPLYFVVREMDINPDKCGAEVLHRLGSQLERLYWDMQPAAEAVQKLMNKAFVNHNRPYYP